MNEIKVPPKIGNYLILDKIGSGSSSVVHLARNVLNNLNCCVKLIPKSRIRNQNDEENLRTEIKILQSVVHPNIIKLYDYCETQNFHCIFQEYFEGNLLLEYVNIKGSLSENETKKIFFQLVSSVSFLHKNKISHRDLKLENILIDQNLKIKLIDFGLSSFTDHLLSTYCGTLPYMPPECILYHPYSGHFADMWSLGIILFALITGKLPWLDKSEQMKSKIIKNDYILPNETPSLCADIISRLLVLNPENRMSADECLLHSWFDPVFAKEMKKILEEPLFPLNLSTSLSHELLFQFQPNSPTILKQSRSQDQLSNHMKIFTSFKNKRPTTKIHQFSKNIQPESSKIQEKASSAKCQSRKFSQNPKGTFMNPSPLVVQRRKPSDI